MVFPRSQRKPYLFGDPTIANHLYEGQDPYRYKDKRFVPISHLDHTSITSATFNLTPNGPGEYDPNVEVLSTHHTLCVPKLVEPFSYPDVTSLNQTPGPCTYEPKRLDLKSSVSYTVKRDNHREILTASSTPAGIAPTTYTPKQPAEKHVPGYQFFHKSPRFRNISLASTEANIGPGSYEVEDTLAKKPITIPRACKDKDLIYYNVPRPFSQISKKNFAEDNYNVKTIQQLQQEKKEKQIEHLEKRKLALKRNLQQYQNRQQELLDMHDKRAKQARLENIRKKCQWWFRFVVLVNSYNSTNKVLINNFKVMTMQLERHNEVMKRSAMSLWKYYQYHFIYYYYFLYLFSLTFLLFTHFYKCVVFLQKQFYHVIIIERRKKQHAAAIVIHNSLKGYKMIRTMKRKVRNLYSTIKVIQYTMTRILDVRHAKIQLIYLCTVQYDKQMRKSFLQKLAPVVTNENSKKDSKDNKKTKKTKVNKEFSNLQLSNEELHEIAILVYEKMNGAYKSLFKFAKQSGADKPLRKSIPPSNYFEEMLIEKYKELVNKIKMSTTNTTAASVSPTPSDKNKS